MSHTTPAPDNVVLLSLGSNIEPRLDRLQRAAKELCSDILTEARCSSIYETDPVGYTEQAPFLNMVITGISHLSATELHRYCKGLEVALGRRNHERWREREIDIDVIYFADEVMSTETLTIPHLHVQDRRFVLQPAVEVAPTLVCPRSGCTMTELLTICTDTSAVRVAFPAFSFPAASQA